MPKSTFYRLTEEKKERILEAAKQEFFRVPYPEASINKIIKAADIPRGSFYQYFEDKKDLFLFVIADQHEKIMGCIRKQMEVSAGDFFGFVFDLIDRFEQIIGIAEVEEFVNRFADVETMRVIDGMIRGDHIFAGLEKEVENMLLDNFDYDCIKASGEQERRYFIRIVSSSIRDSLKQYVCPETKVSPDELCTELRGRIRLLESVFKK